MKWIELNTQDTLETIAASNSYAIIFKHSTRCPVSSMAKRTFEFESSLIPEETPVYLVDLIKYREISNQIADKWKVRHESPQVLLIKGDDCVYNESHNEIEVAKIVVKMAN
ncbi:MULTISPECIES: bacillithiol system redox-active protein YtxJ [Olivibacter]|jgi:bacillithiol system protein YtxJ|uniref:Bacillithiol system redox-active protein YtxJ n=3 Tax=Sphingobacteriaceae TaxID=84566 RepID=F4C7T9_SPHS2|nr:MULTISPECIES: bacillithiol system redox-active protein YtxJ [Olivibacter]MCL4638184.1 bacillithiol system redox-active protein YtxJ [Olivibacter sp. UJ_SKK_5.1]MDM8173957.1 bacillithiol system redox-active protein YtxJ [Olivibacter sp. 47]QEL03744.1 bacillithiol system redox-active protein YtxJ [Olivibacter sp. LS-1]